MGLKTEPFASLIAQWSSVALDSAILIYHLEDIALYSELTELLLCELARGTLSATLSTLTVTELLAKPFAKGPPSRIAAGEYFLQSLPNTRLVAPDYSIAREAARLRGIYSLRTPDAVHLATALSENSDAFLTNDKCLKKIQEHMPIVCLEDYLSA